MLHLTSCVPPSKLCGQGGHCRAPLSQGTTVAARGSRGKMLEAPPHTLPGGATAQLTYISPLKPPAFRIIRPGLEGGGHPLGSRGGWGTSHIPWPPFGFCPCASSALFTLCLFLGPSWTGWTTSRSHSRGRTSSPSNVPPAPPRALWVQQLRGPLAPASLGRAPTPRPLSLQVGPWGTGQEARTEPSFQGQMLWSGSRAQQQS